MEILLSTDKKTNSLIRRGSYFIVRPHFIVAVLVLFFFRITRWVLRAIVGFKFWSPTSVVIFGYILYIYLGQIKSLFIRTKDIFNKLQSVAKVKVIVVLSRKFASGSRSVLSLNLCFVTFFMPRIEWSLHIAFVLSVCLSVVNFNLRNNV